MSINYNKTSSIKFQEKDFRCSKLLYADEGLKHSEGNKQLRML